MATNVEPEEAEAIRDLMGAADSAAPEVVDRDFRSPRRLAAAEIEALTRDVHAVLREVEGQLSTILGTKFPIELASIGETTAAGLFNDGEDSFAAIRLNAGGQHAWVVWDSLAAVRTVERVLGSTAQASETRRFSTVECSVLEGLLSAVADGVLRALGVEASDVVVAQSRETLGDWQGGGEGADPHRLHIELAVDGPGEPSTINVYVPLERPAEDAHATEARPVELPEHLSRVQVEVSVRVKGCEVALDELLALEEGDVIPLDARIDDLAQLCVDSRSFGFGTIGTSNGNIAIRIDRLAGEDEESK